MLIKNHIFVDTTFNHTKKSENYCTDKHYTMPDVTRRQDVRITYTSAHVAHSSTPAIDVSSVNHLSDYCQTKENDVITNRFFL